MISHEPRAKGIALQFSAKGQFNKSSATALNKGRWPANVFLDPASLHEWDFFKRLS